MKNFLLATAGKAISFTSQVLNRGHGSTWPGHIALKLHKSYIKDLLKHSSTQVILVVGTNGKTTTGKMLTTILKENHKKVFQNNSGANLLNGIASSLLLHTNPLGKLSQDYAIFEVDENNLPFVLEEITPKAIIALDLFRDQLDRYGELDSIAKKWQEAFSRLLSSTELILNADDPLVAYLGLSLKHLSVSYFGLDKSTESGTTLQHAADSLYCPKCNTKLSFQKIFYSHLGLWKCPHCKLERPIPNLSVSYYPLDGIYNKYNTLAAVLTARTLGISQKEIDVVLHHTVPAFGRQEKLMINGKQVQIFLAKNPTSFNESLRTISEKGAKYVAFILNDQIPDGRDISWIWDIDLEFYVDKFNSIFIAGDRVYDLGLRIAYSSNDKFQISNFKSNPKFHMFESLKEMLQTTIEQTPINETLYILPTYSAMLEVRKILTGRKIL